MGGTPTQTTKQTASGNETGTTSIQANGTNSLNSFGANTGTSSGTNVGTTAGTSLLNGSTGPLAQSLPMLSQILQSAQGVPINTSASPEQNAAFQGMQSASGAAANLNPQILGDTGFLLGGGGVGQNNGYLTNSFRKASGALSPYLGTSFLDPSTNPYLAPSISALNDQITNNTKQAFAQSGRFGDSGDFTRANAMGLASAEMPLLLNQFNTNAGLQQGAANSLYNMGQGTSGALDTSAATRAGIMSGAPSMIGSTFNPFMTALQTANMQAQLPWTNLGYASQFLTPLAQLGGTSSQFGANTGFNTGMNTGLTSGMNVGAQQGTTSNTSQGTSATQSNSRSKGTVQQSQNPLQTALGAGLGLLSLL